MNLYEKLLAYSKSDALPMHMPGHKRNTEMCDMENPYGFDITEIAGFDNLHEPESVLLEAQQMAAQLYGTDECRFLINGSTAGILAGICGSTHPGDHVLIARNCHKSVYHALIMNRLQPVYLHPAAEETCGMILGADPKEIEQILKRDEEHKIRLAVITSPTYEGVISDIAEIAGICHKYGIPLMVDEAHGAHLNPGTSEAHPFPLSAAACGADLVVQSLHKTLPALTQTALLHRNGDLVDSSMIKFYLDIVQTSSPSYILMASIVKCLEMMKDSSWIALLNRWNASLQDFYERTRDLRILDVFNPDLNRDPSKLVITTARSRYTGRELMELLRNEYEIEPEMASEKYVIAMTGAGDTPETIRRFTDAVIDIDRRWAEENAYTEIQMGTSAAMIREETAMNPEEAFRASCRTECMQEEVLDAQHIGRTALDFLYIYPPGIPLTVPGEVITEAVLEKIRDYEKASLEVIGYRDPQKKTIRFLK